MNEEYLNQAANDYCRVNLYDGKYCRQDVYEAFQDGMKHTMELPLADRLSESEKEKLRDIYNAGVESLKHYQRINREAKDVMQANTAVVIYNQHKERLSLLESIFGKNLFNPTEQ